MAYVISLGKIQLAGMNGEHSRVLRIVSKPKSDTMNLTGSTKCTAHCPPLWSSHLHALSQLTMSLVSPHTFCWTTIGLSIHSTFTEYLVCLLLNLCSEIIEMDMIDPFSKEIYEPRGEAAMSR